MTRAQAAGTLRGFPRIQDAIDRWDEVDAWRAAHNGKGRKRA
jgi:hypothetical protein